MSPLFCCRSLSTASDENNDPWGEHDCALRHVRAAAVLQDRLLLSESANLSPDPSDPAVTILVMTVCCRGNTNALRCTRHRGTTC
ncbi:DUF3768 domain-containing protein [Mesorhizobium sp.]|uniref:DUF3768 domain-containing protein n=1 Tax=Mesorhizobium sp. TaxID=1871066 RepID=UPI00341F6ADE